MARGKYIVYRDTFEHPKKFKQMINDGWDYSDYYFDRERCGSETGVATFYHLEDAVDFVENYSRLVWCEYENGKYYQNQIIWCEDGGTVYAWKTAI